VSTASRTPDEITAEIAETRERLATTIDTLVYRSAPKTILSRRLESIKAKFVTPDGSPDMQMIGKVAGGVLGFVVLVVVIRKVTG
jgi:hypothetical protein